jgi:serine/threonine-protein kinase
VSRAPTAGAPVTSRGPITSTRAVPFAGERIGKYIVERMLGSGGMGVVLAARHERLDERVAIKVLHAKAAMDSVQCERLVGEARSIVRIQSEHVVRVLDAGVEERTGAPFIVMEHLEGRDLGQVLSDNGPMSVQMAVDCIIQVCEGVAAAHAIGVIHRDLKPSNFFMTRRGDGTPLVKVLDFGISKVAGKDGVLDRRLTEIQPMIGSPMYMSPEQIRSSKNVDARSDVWSLGVALFELLTCKLPFVANNVAGLLMSILDDAPFPITTFVTGVPVELEAVVLACLEKDPGRRIGSALELAVRLMPFASPDGVRLVAGMDRVARGVRGCALATFAVSPPASRFAASATSLGAMAPGSGQDDPPDLTTPMDHMGRGLPPGTYPGEPHAGFGPPGSVTGSGSGGYATVPLGAILPQTNDNTDPARQSASSSIRKSPRWAVWLSGVFLLLAFVGLGLGGYSVTMGKHVSPPRGTGEPTASTAGVPSVQVPPPASATTAVAPPVVRHDPPVIPVVRPADPPPARPDSPSSVDPKPRVKPARLRGER